MEADVLFEGIARGEFHRADALKCADLFTLDPSFYSALTDELSRLVSRNAPSEVHDKDHPSNWTRPTGKAIQFSLFNESGDFADSSGIGSIATKGKRFHHATTYPALADFIAMFPHLINMRLNGLGANSGLAPHKVNSSWWQGRRWYFTVRFHLPIVTNPQALVLLDGDLFHFQPGRVYFFHNGCIHSAYNGGETERFHLIWDMLLTQETVDRMFGDESYPPLMRTPGESRAVPVVKSVEVDEFEVLAARQHYERLRLRRLNVDPRKWGLFYLRCRYAWYRLGRPSVATIE